MPKVSIIIPTYNRARLLRESLQSALAQTFSDFEIIVTDNSVDNEAEIIIHELQDSRITYVRNAENIGAVNNHNKALRLAKGEYIYLFSDDDIMLPDNLQEKVTILDEQSSVGLVYSNVSLISEEGIVSDKLHWTNLNKEWQIVTASPLMAKDTAYKLLFYETLFICMPTVMLRKSILDKNCIEFNNQLKYMIDWDIFLKMSMFSNFFFINKKLILYRFHGNNETHKLSRSNYFLELLVAKLSIDTLYRKQNNDYPEKGALDVYQSTLQQIAWWEGGPKKEHLKPSLAGRIKNRLSIYVKKFTDIISP